MLKHADLFSIISLALLFSGNMVYAAPIESAVKQLREISGENLPADFQLNVLFKVGVISANGMILGSTYSNGGISAVISELDSCYSRASTTKENVVNFMLCYISDKTVLGFLDGQAKNQGGIWKDLAVEYENGLQVRLSNVMNIYGVQPDMRQSFKNDFDAAQTESQRWIETLTIGQVSACIESGIGTADCP
jgi:hypothetical protein